MDKIKVKEFYINNMTWSNAACKGYVIDAMEKNGFSNKDIDKVIRNLKYSFDFLTIKEAEEIYNKSKY